MQPRFPQKKFEDIQYNVREKLPQKNFTKNIAYNVAYIIIKSLNYLYDRIPVTNQLYRPNGLPHKNIKYQWFKSRLFPLTIIEQNKLGLNIRESQKFENFKLKILTFTRLSLKFAFYCHNSGGFEPNFSIHFQCINFNIPPRHSKFPFQVHT